MANRTTWCGNLGPEVGEKSDTDLQITSGVTHGTTAGPMFRRLERRAASLGTGAWVEHPELINDCFGLRFLGQGCMLAEGYHPG